jgi:hypothetical protein
METILVDALVFSELNESPADLALMYNALTTKNNIQRRLIADLVRNATELPIIKYREGVQFGMTIPALLIKYGYVPKTDGLFAKEVEIVPKSFIYNGFMYMFDDKDVGKFKITRMEINMETFSSGKLGNVICAGIHPNVSDSHVMCTGELREKYNNMDLSQENIIPELLADLEHTLSIVNFDSAYGVPNMDISAIKDRGRRVDVYTSAAKGNPDFKVELDDSLLEAVE